MKRRQGFAYGLFAGSVSLSLLLVGCGSQTPSEGPSRIEGNPSFVSDDLRYAKFALSNDGSKTLNVVFDESRGTGKGYDLVYADVDFRGSFESATRAKAATWKRRKRLDCRFPPIALDLPTTADSALMSGRCTIVFSLSNYSRKNPAQETFAAQTRLMVQGKSGSWSYQFSEPFTPARDPATAPVANLLTPPEIRVATQRDKKRHGQTGIALSLVRNNVPVAIRRPNVPLRAQVEIKDAAGEVVHKGEGRLADFAFG